MHSCSYLSEKCFVKASTKNNIGVFAREIILKGELICAWGGIVFTETEILKKAKQYPKLITHPIAIYDNLFLIPINANKLEDADRFNHSCNPNAGIKGQILLISRKKIMPNEEICFDYETAAIGRSDGLPFKCKCQSKKCRKKITGKAWKSPSFRRKNKGFLSWYIERKIEKFLNKNSKA